MNSTQQPDHLNYYPTLLCHVTNYRNVDIFPLRTHARCPRKEKWHIKNELRFSRSIYHELHLNYHLSYVAPFHYYSATYDKML